MAAPADPFAHAADLLDPPTDPYLDDPAGWVRDRLGETLWSKQREILESVRDNKRTAVRSCHEVGKSFVAARLAAWWLSVHPPDDVFVVSTAPSWSQVQNILWKEIRRAHRKGDLPGYVTQQAEWKIGEGAVGLGRKPPDYDEDSFQGIHERFVLLIIDEACGVPKGLWTGGEAITTGEHCRILAIGNPDDPATEFAECFRPGSTWSQIHIPAESSPQFTGEDLPDDVRSRFLPPSTAEAWRQRWGENSPLYRSKVLAEFPDASEDTLIPWGAITRAQQRAMDSREVPILSVDVARYGSDETVVGERRGPIFRVRSTHARTSTTETTGLAIAALRDTGACEVRVDGDGIGGGVVDELAEQDQPVVEMRSGLAALDADMFKNSRAEWWWGLRQRFEDDDVDVDADDDELAGQLAQMKYSYTSRGQVKVETKEEMRARGLPSPDRADTCMLAFAHVPDEPGVVTYDPEDDVEFSLG